MPLRRPLYALALAAVLLAGCAGNKPQAAPTPSAPPTIPTIPVPNQSSLSPWAESLASEDPYADDEDDPASGPWTPCSTEDPDIVTGGYNGPDGCKPLEEDICDAAYASQKTEGQGQMLDMLIENEMFIDGARFKDCPQFAAAWKKAQAGFDDGDWEVGKDVKAGTYQTTAHLSGGKVTDCYWERAGKNGRTIDNDMVTAATKVTVTIRASDEMFSTQGCGDWVPVG